MTEPATTSAHLTSVVKALTGEQPQLAHNPFGRCTASIMDGCVSFKGCGATHVSALWDLLGDFARHQRDVIEEREAM